MYVPALISPCKRALVRLAKVFSKARGTSLPICRSRARFYRHTLAFPIVKKTQLWSHSAHAQLLPRQKSPLVVDADGHKRTLGDLFIPLFICRRASCNFVLSVQASTSCINKCIDLHCCTYKLLYTKIFLYISNEYLFFSLSNKALLLNPKFLCGNAERTSVPPRYATGKYL